MLKCIIIGKIIPRNKSYNVSILPVMILWTPSEGNTKTVGVSDHFVPLFHRNASFNKNRKRTLQISNTKGLSLKPELVQKKIFHYVPTKKLCKKDSNDDFVNQFNPTQSAKLTGPEKKLGGSLSNSTITISTNFKNIGENSSKNPDHSSELSNTDSQSDHSQLRKSQCSGKDTELLDKAGTTTDKGHKTSISKPDEKSGHKTKPFKSEFPLHPYDICLYKEKTDKKLTNIEIMDLIQNVFQPDQYFKFPVSPRSFRKEWVY